MRHLIPPPPPLGRLTALAAGLALLLPALATAEVVPAHNNYKPVIVLDNPGRNVLTGCGGHGRVATLRLHVPPPQTDGNAWDGSYSLHIQATGSHQLFQFRDMNASNTNWRDFFSNGRLVFEQQHAGQYTIEVRVKTGQNIGYGGEGEIYLSLRKNDSFWANNKYKVYSPAIQLRAAGGKGCQTRTQNPTCRGFWDWSGGIPTCLLE